MATTKKPAAKKEVVDKKNMTKEMPPVKTTIRKLKKTSSLQIDVMNMKGDVVETIALSRKMFDASVNETLMAQAVRVYLANQRVGAASTKSRGEVKGSTRKIYRQKGTGRARHGGVRAPIFVGGGIAFGPKPRDYSLAMPQKMRQKALFSALTVKNQKGDISVISDLTEIKPKTKDFLSVLASLKFDLRKKNILLVLDQKTENIQLAARNIEGVTYILANQLNTYEILNTQKIIFLKEALKVLEDNFERKKN